MDAHRWRRIEAIFADALEKTPEARDAFLNGACADDSAMRSELSSLLEAHRRNGSFLEPSTRRSQGEDTQAHVPLTAGARLGAFEIVAPIGSGGMGTVYHARDTRLERAVALKFLAHRRDLRDTSSERFQREARAISRLSHPHICTLYDIARAPVPPDGDDGEFLVMELVKGETLADVVARGPLSVEDAVQYAIEMADALAHAHREGIVHRDLKPQNIMITPGGVKLLDFGVAAFTESESHASPAWPGISRVAGTVQYMAPEQIRGEEVDGRTDLFGLGLVLHEMLTARRVRTIDDARNAARDSERGGPAVARDCSGGLAADCWTLPRERPRTTNVIGSRFGCGVAVGERLVASALYRRWDREDTAMVAARQRRLVGWTRARGSRLWPDVVIEGVTGPPCDRIFADHERRSAENRGPRHRRISTVPDGSGQQRTGHDAGPGRGRQHRPSSASLPQSGPGRLSANGSELFVGSYVNPGPFPYWLVPLAGGPPRRLGDLRAHDVHPSPDGSTLVYVVESDVFVSRADGSDARKVATFPKRYPGYAAWAPDGRKIRFSLTDYRAGGTSIWEVAPDGRDLRPILSGWSNPPAECCGRWTPDGGHFIFQAKQNGVTSLWAIREPLDYWRSGTSLPVRLTEEGSLHFRSPTPSKDGRKVFAIGDEVRGEIMRRDAGSGEWTPYTLGSKVRSMSELSFSPDASRIAYVNYPEGTLWSSRIDGTDDRQLTFPPMIASWPSWSPDGQRLAFHARVPGERWKIHVISTAGGAAVRLTSGSESEGGAAWSPDGHRIVFGGSPFFEPGSGGPTNLRSFDFRTGRTTEIPGSEGVWAARWSPDGRYLVAHRFDFAELRLLDIATGRWEQLAKGVLHFANWSRDSQYLFFESWGEDTAVIRIRIKDRKREKIGTLKQFRRTTGPERCWSGLTPDHSVLVLRDVGSQEIYGLTLEEH